MTERQLTPTSEFLNVDLDVRSRRSLSPLLKAWPEAQTPGRAGAEAPRRIHTSGVSYKKTADKLARELIESVDQLPADARKCWKEASSRCFDIGIQAGLTPYNFEEVRLSDEVIRGMARLRIALLVTIYAPNTK